MLFKWLLCVLPPLSVLAMPGYHAPWGKDADLRYEPPVLEISPPDYSMGVRLARAVIHFHQTVISPVDGPRSSFRPSSSAYMKGAMEKHGFVTGFLMGCDRLIRENGDPWVYRTIESEGQLFKYDPVP